MFEKVNIMERKQIESNLERKQFETKTEKQLEEIFNYIESNEESNQKIFFDGQIFDAFSIIVALIEQADKKIVLIDGYVDVGTLNIIAKKKDDVEVCIYTLPNTKLTTLDIANFNKQYSKLEVKKTTVFHDRFLVLDDSMGYHIGASIKDAGKKCFGINKIEDMNMINEVIQRAETNVLL